MITLRSILVLAFQALGPCAAWDISVSSSGGNKTSGHQNGFLHEDINNSGDGGIYAELIRNRAFQGSNYYPVNLDGWHSINSRLSLANLSEPLSSALPTSMKVAPAKAAGAVGFANDGYWGMAVEKKRYEGSFWVRGAYEGVFTASLQSNITGDIFGAVEVQSEAVAGRWVEHRFELVPHMDAPSSNNTFAITFDPEGLGSDSLDFNLISLFPPTYKGRKNGLRIDLAEALEELHPRVLRIPGGAMLQGLDNQTWWDWKDTLHPLHERPGFAGTWGYQQTHGLGLLEYLQWAEDMNLVLIVGVWSGASLDGAVVSEEALQFYINDALDQIEFIVGPTSSPWGARRAALGHPEPFDLRYVEIGNEDWLKGGPEAWASYIEWRFPRFLEAISAAYPDLQVVSSGAAYDGHDVPEPAIGDYHPYRKPDELVAEFSMFDNAKGHIIGEVAATHVNGGSGWEGSIHPYPWWIGTVAEAVAMIGYERNGDRVPATLYAPVLKHLDRWQWPMTLVSFAADPKLTTRSTSWHLWSLFASAALTHTLPVEGDVDGPLYHVAGRGEGGTLVWKGAVYNTTDGESVDLRVAFEGVREGATARLRTLTVEGGDPWAYNDPYSGEDVVEREERRLVAGEGGWFEFGMEQLSIAVLETRVCKRD